MLSLFFDDVELDPLLSKLALKITQNRIETIRQSSIDISLK